MKLNVVSIDKGLVRIHADGEITSQDFGPDARSAFEAVLGAGWAAHQVVLDMGGVPYLDSSAIGWLMTSRREFERAGGLVVLHSVQPRVRQIFDLLRVGKAVPVVEDEAAALTVVRAAAAGLTVAAGSNAPAAKSAAPRAKRGSRAA